MSENIIAQAESLWDLLERRVEVSGDDPMITDEHGGGLTFAEFARRSERVAAGLLAQGITPGSTVSWQLPTRIDTVVVSMALSRLGVTQNPIIPIYRSREVGAMIDQCGSQWLITLDSFRGFDHRTMAEGLRTAGPAPLQLLILSDHLPEADPSALPPQPAGTDHSVRWIYTTSGTTSTPKGVCHSDATLIAGGVGLADAIKATASDVSTIFYPYAHIGGPDMLIAALAVGMSLVTMEIYDPARAVDLMRRQGVTLTGGGPPHYSLLLAEQRKQPRTPVVPTLRALTGGGAPMAESLYREVCDEVDIPILHAYGMTECPMIAAAGPDDTDEQLATTSGRPVLGCEVQIRDEQDKVLAVGESGRVWLRGTMLFKHYLADGEVVKPFDDQGWLFTGDIGYVRPDGHIVLVGREKDLIIRKGESISPMEIEEVLAHHSAVADVAVIGLPDDVRGERICAVLQLHSQVQIPDLDEIRAHCRAAGLSPNKFPEQIETISDMPKTPTMKIRKQHLRNEFAVRGLDSDVASAGVS